MTAAISRSIPPQRLVNLMNPLVRALLRSPVHAAMDRAVLILHVIGRRTGHRYDIPVSYVQLDGRFVVVTQHTWRANLPGGAAIQVTQARQRTPTLTELEQAVRDYQLATITLNPR